MKRTFIDVRDDIATFASRIRRLRQECPRTKNAAYCTCEVCQILTRVENELQDAESMASQIASEIKKAREKPPAWLEDAR